MTPVDHQRLTHALREMNAAGNSLRRACAEVVALIPAGLTVLHRTPDKPDGPDTVYWSYYGGTPVTWSTERGGETTRAVIVVAPAPNAEYLPRLEEGI